ncbi:MAG: hypothetical protein ACP5IE_00225 [Infirmifilum sp.]
MARRPLQALAVAILCLVDGVVVWWIGAGCLAHSCVPATRVVVSRAGTSDYIIHRVTPRVALAVKVVPLHKVMDG